MRTLSSSQSYIGQSERMLLISIDTTDARNTIT